MLARVLRLYRGAFAGLPRDVWLLSLVMLINRSGSMVLPFLTLYLTQARGVSVEAAGRLLGLYGLGAIAGAWIGGWLTDRIGATPTQQLSLLAGGAGFLVLAVLREPAAIAAALLAQSLVAEAYRPSAMADMARRAPERVRLRSLALLRLAVNLGLAVGPAVGGFLALRDYRWLFVADGLTCWAAAGVLALALGRAPAAASVRPAATERRSPWTDRPYLGLMALVFLVAVVFFQIMSTMPLYFRQVHGLRENAVGLLLGFNALLVVLFEMVIVHGTERLDRMGVIGLGACLVCLGFGAMPLGHGVAFLGLTVVTWSVGEMLSLPHLNAVVASRAEGFGGRYIGLYTSAFSLALVVGPPLGTWIYQRFGDEALWYGIAAAGPLLWIHAAALRRPLAHDSSAPSDPA
jgi:MFS family permease